MKLAARFKDFPPYIPIEPFEVLSARLERPLESIIKLDANENLYGPSEYTLQALANISFPHIYPDPESRALRSALSQFTGVPEKFLIAGAGADELIDLLLRVLLDPGDRVIISPPTFGMYSFDTLLNTGQLIEINRKEDFSIDLPAIQEAVQKYSPKVLFLATPNNPDGSFPPSDTIEALLSLPVLVVLDEAYIEFCGPSGHFGQQYSRIKQVIHHNNLVILRTFSKWAGLAGLRVGYGAFPEWLLSTLWNAKQPYNVNVAASVAAIASLQDLDNIQKNIQKIQTERERLYQALQKIKYLHPFPSNTNFILCKVKGFSALNLKKFLESQGILVRYYNSTLLKDYIRISIGKPEHSEILLKQLQAFSTQA